MNGHVLIGSTLERVGFNKEVTASANGQLKEAALEMINEFENFQFIDHWAGLRPESKNGIPIISEHQNIEGLFCNCGHYRNGILLAPASAKLICGLIRKEESIFDPSPYRWI